MYKIEKVASFLAHFARLDLYLRNSLIKEGMAWKGKGSKKKGKANRNGTLSQRKTVHK